MDSTAYQSGRQALLAGLEQLRDLREELSLREPQFVNNLPADAQQKLLHLDRDISRLRNPDLTVAFVGGFSAGKSSLVNAFLGRYLLPESTKVTTAVPTFVRSGGHREEAELHYLNKPEVDELGELYRREITQAFRVPHLAGAPVSELLVTVRGSASEGRGKGLFEQFERYLEQAKRRDFGPRGQVRTCSIEDAQRVIRDESDAMFLDRVELRIANSDLPEDVVLVDLPGVSVPNPRHRQVTFRFVTQDAHAVVLVLMATRLFDKDEVDIMELVRSGESRVADKTFWVLNRWDSLSIQQQQQTIADFESKMEQFKIPKDFVAFRTNALHGLLAQLCLRGDVALDAQFQKHLEDYERVLSSRYGSSHEAALRESQIPLVQEHVLRFLNDRLRATTLRSALDNTRANFATPLLHHIRRAKDADDSLVDGELKRREKETTRHKIDELSARRLAELKAVLQGLRDEAAIQRETLLLEHANELVERLREAIQSGSETDAYEIYKRIVADQELRKFPYYFEIEMRIVDNLNTILKRSFRAIVQEQVGRIFDRLTRAVRDVLDLVYQDVGFDPSVSERLEAIVRGMEASFRDRVDGVVMDRAAMLDELLLYKPKGFFGFLSGGNEIVEGLERAARRGCEQLHNTNQVIRPEDMQAKTQLIRETLADHYLDKAAKFHEAVAKAVFTIVINNMQELERGLVDQMRTKYVAALEGIKAKESEGEFVKERETILVRSRRYREAIERIEDVMGQMTTTLSSLIAPAPVLTETRPSHDGAAA